MPEVPTMPAATPVVDCLTRNEHLTDNERELLDAGEMLWVMLANVSGGDWSKQTEEWQKYARKWADKFHAVAAKLNAKVS